MIPETVADTPGKYLPQMLIHSDIFTFWEQLVAYNRNPYNTKYILGPMDKQSPRSSIYIPG